MSTLKVSSIANPSASTASITLAADGSMTGSFPAPNRNLLYNGAMQVAQRGTSTASITTGGYYTADRFFIGLNALGTWTQSVESDAPTGSGLSKSLKMLATTADAAPAAADYTYFEQGLEGLDLQRIAKGTASAQQLTLSFWVKSNKTGTYVVMLYDGTNARAVCATYSVSASATWEKKTITFPADTTGAFANTNAGALYIRWQLALGSDFTSGTLATTWASYSAANSGVGQTNLAAATNNYWQVTGVQLEVGAAPTAFEFKSYGQELRECQRYYQIVKAFYGAGNSSTTIAISVPFLQQMRAAPTPGLEGPLQVSDGTADFIQSSAQVTSIGATTGNSMVTCANFSGLTGNRVYVGARNLSNTNGFTFSAEL